jgi:hypothetical protein
MASEEAVIARTEVFFIKIRVEVMTMLPAMERAERQ